MKIQFKMTSGLGTKRRKIQADFFTKNKKVKKKKKKTSSRMKKENIE